MKAPIKTSQTPRYKSVDSTAYEPQEYEFDSTFLATVRENKLALIASALLVGVWLLLWANYELSELNANTKLATDANVPHALAKTNSK